MKLPPTQNKIPKIPILMYHEVSDDTERSERTRQTNPPYCLSLERFREQMEHIHTNGYETISLANLFKDSGQNRQKRVVLTFDDGWQNNYTHAFPILIELGLVATIFVITDFVGKPNYVTWANLKEMNRNGISVQSHTSTHRPLTALATTEIKHELEQSKKTIEHHLGTLVDFLSAPHGMIDQKVIHVARSLGYKAICTSDPGFAHSYSDTSIMRRINISYKYKIATFEKFLSMNHYTILLTILSKKTKNFAKTLIGWNNYRRIYLLIHRVDSKRL